jgi:hypothetical protein
MGQTDAISSAGRGRVWLLCVMQACGTRVSCVDGFETAAQRLRWQCAGFPHDGAGARTPIALGTGTGTGTDTRRLNCRRRSGVVVEDMFREERSRMLIELGQPTARAPLIGCQPRLTPF